MPQVYDHRFLAAQRGFLPRDLPGLALWLDAAYAASLYQAAAGAAAAADGDPVGQWQDRSGNGRHVAQATASVKPTLKLNIQNGLNVVRFDGVDDVLASANYAHGQQFTVFAVCKMTGGDSTPFSADSAAPRQFLLRTQTSTATNLQVFDSGGGAYSDSKTRTAGVFHILAGVRRGTEVELYVDGATDGPTATLNTPATNNLPFTVGGPNFAGLRFGGDIAEILYYSSALINRDRARAEAYLKYKWGTP